MPSLHLKFLNRIACFAMCLLSLSVVAPSNVSASILGIKCETYSTKVKINALLPEEYDLVGELCYQGTFQGKTVQVLLHGGGYNSVYWDFPYAFNKYSYVRDAVLSGYAAFNVDRIGHGQSGKPDGLLVNLDNSTYTIHQLVQKLRNGSLTGYSFDKVVAVGHSMGSMIAVALASQYQGDVDAVALTGYIHNMGPGALEAPTKVIPAQLDPKFGLTHPANYFSLLPNTRAGLFYNTAYTEPGVIVTDEIERETVSLGLLMDLGRLFSNESLNINVPVFIEIGANDYMFCGNGVECTQTSLEAHEAPYFSPAAQLEVKVIPNSGHNLALHVNASTSNAAVINWINQKVGN